MDMIERKKYLERLITRKENGLVKVITGIRRCGKSYLLFNIYKSYLRSIGVEDEQIICLALDDDENIQYRNPLELGKYIRSMTTDESKTYYVFLDEIQKVVTIQNPYIQGVEDKIGFVDVVLGLMKHDNIDVYVTGSNSKMLSSDILTEFRGRSDEIRVHPLSFAEYFSAVGGDKDDAFDEYAFYGGMPFVLSRPNDTAKMKYLESLFNEVYIKDIVERMGIKHEDVLKQVLDLICSSIGSLTNPKKISDTIRSMTNTSISQNTITSYIGHLEDAFLISESKRYDVKGKSYFEYPYKYYCEDIGLRNARIGFRQQEMTHIMENIIYNELIVRGFSVDVGVVYSREQNSSGNYSKVAREIDFVAVKGGRKVYIQSAFALPDEEKAAQEMKPFALTGDSFPKVIIRKDIRKRWYDDRGVLNIGLIDFLLDENSI